MLKEQGNGRSVPHPGRVLQQGAPADWLLTHLQLVLFVNYSEQAGDIYLICWNATQKLLELITCFPVMTIIIVSTVCHRPDQHLLQNEINEYFYVGPGQRLENPKE